MSMSMSMKMLNLTPMGTVPAAGTVSSSLALASGTVPKVILTSLNDGYAIQLR